MHLHEMICIHRDDKLSTQDYVQIHQGDIPQSKQIIHYLGVSMASSESEL